MYLLTHNNSFNTEIYVESKATLAHTNISDMIEHVQKVFNTEMDISQILLHQAAHSAWEQNFPINIIASYKINEFDSKCNAKNLNYYKRFMLTYMMLMYVTSLYDFHYKLLDNHIDSVRWWKLQWDENNLIVIANHKKLY